MFLVIQTWGTAFTLCEIRNKKQVLCLSNRFIVDYYSRRHMDSMLKCLAALSDRASASSTPPGLLYFFPATRHCSLSLSASAFCHSGVQSVLWDSTLPDNVDSHSATKKTKRVSTKQCCLSDLLKTI